MRWRSVLRWCHPATVLSGINQSGSNDASLLLPVRSAGASFRTVAWPTWLPTALPANWQLWRPSATCHVVSQCSEMQPYAYAVRLLSLEIVRC
jgi:hypothetical protein